MFRTGLTIIRCHREPTTEVIVAVRRAVSHFKCLLGTVRPRLAASIITQILQHALRTQAKPLRLAPDPIQQQHSPGNWHAFSAKRKRGAASTVSKSQGTYFLHGIPIAKFCIIGYHRSKRWVPQYILPERGKTAVAIGAHLGEKSFQCVCAWSGKTSAPFMAGEVAV